MPPQKIASNPAFTRADSIPQDLDVPTSPYLQMVDLTNFKPHADGVTDDWAIIQSAIISTPDGGELHFQTGKIYALSKSLDFRGKTIHIKGHGATPLVCGPSYPNNQAMNFGAMLVGAPPLGTNPVTTAFSPSSPGYTTLIVISGTLTAGMYSFSHSDTPLTPGTIVAASFGVNVGDSTLSDISFLAEVISDTSGTITLDTPLPKDINGTYHHMGVVSALGDNCTIENLKLDWSSTITPNAQITIDWARNYRITELSGRFCIGIGVSNCQNFMIDNMKGDLVLTSSSAAHAISGWLCSQFKVSNILLNSSVNAAAFFLEGGFRDTSFKTIQLNSTATDSHWTQGVFHCPTTENIYVDGLTIIAPVGSLIILASDGGAPPPAGRRNFTVDNLRTNVNFYGGNMTEIQSGMVAGIALGPKQTFRYSIPLSSRDTNHILQLVKGVVSKLYLKLPSHITSVNFRANQAGPQVNSPTLTLGSWFEFVDGNFDQSWNYPSNAGVGDCYIIDDGSANSSDTVEVLAEVYLCGQSFAGSQ